MIRGLFIYLIYLMPLLAFGTEEKILFSYKIHGGAFAGYISDEIQVFESKKVLWKTLSNFPRSLEQNSIGTFVYTLEQKKFDALLVKASSLHGFLKSQKKKVSESELHEIFSMQGAEYEIPPQEKEKKILNLVQGLRDFYTESKISAQAQMALKLECQNDEVKGMIYCQYKNVGKEIIHTLDPKGVESSIRCLDLNRHSKIVNVGKIGDPRKMNPGLVKVLPGESFSFEFSSRPECEVQVIVKTTDMLVNEKFKHLVLGELHSNLLPPKKERK